MTSWPKVLCDRPCQMLNLDLKGATKHINLSPKNAILYFEHELWYFQCCAFFGMLTDEYYLTLCLFNPEE